MNAITSYLRHVIVVGVLFLVAKYKLPLEGASEMADALALAGIGTVTWLVVKYAPEFAKHIGLLALLLVGGISCTPGQVAALRAIPVKACVITPQGRVCYSEVEGLSAEIDRRGGGK